MRLPLTRYPDFATGQPFLDEIISHPAPDAFRAAQNFRRTIDIPGFHVTTWFDIFQLSVMAAFNEIQARAGNQKLWIGPNEHYFVYHNNFWRHDPYFAWFDYWLKGEANGVMDGPAVYYSPRAWVDGSRELCSGRLALRPSAGRRPMPAHSGSICAATAASPIGRTGPRGTIVTTRVGRSQPWAAATC